MPWSRVTLLPNGGEKKHDEIGMLLLPETFMCVEVFSHESLHLATSYVRKIRKSVKLKSEIDEDIEERLAYTTGVCASQIHIGLIDAGLLPRKQRVTSRESGDSKPRIFKAAAIRLPK
jgi:hypothetical protein